MHRPARSRRLAAALATATLAALSAGATAAHADSIVFVKGGDVFRATPDGARVQQVTRTGGYSSVSQDDAGRMVALHGDKLAHIDRDGSVLSEIETPARGSADGMDFEGVYDPQLSPDGTKVSYTYYWRYVTGAPGCEPRYGCTVNRLYHGTAYTDPDHLTAWDEPGYRRQTGWIHGDWIDNATQLLSDPSMKPNEDLVLASPDAPNSDQGLKRWAEDSYAKQMVDATLTRDKSKLASITGANQEYVWFYDARDAFYPDYPELCRSFYLDKPAGGAFREISWSPDGSTLAYADGDGIATFHLPAPGAGKGECGTATEDTKLILPGASSPDWGRADLPADPAPQPGTNPGGNGGTPQPGTTPGGNGGTPQLNTTPGTVRPGSGSGSGSGSGTGSGTGSGSSSGNGTGGGTGSGSANGAPSGSAATSGATVRVTRSSLGAALRSGLKLSVSGAGAGQRTFLARSGKQIVAKGKARISADGQARVTLRFTAAGRKRLTGKRSAKLLVTGAGASLTVTLKR